MPVTFDSVLEGPRTFTNNPDITGTANSAVDNYGIAIWSRSDDLITSPTRNGKAFTELYRQTFGYGGFSVFGQLPDVGTFTVDSPNTPSFRLTTTAWLVLSGVSVGTPLGTVLSENENGTGWTAPALSPAGSTGDLLVSILLLNNWGGTYDNTAPAVITPGGAQTLRLDRPYSASPGVGEPRIIITTAPIGSAMTYSFSGGFQPTYGHVAFAVKESGGGPPPASFRAYYAHT